MSIGETRRQRRQQGPWTVDDLEELPDDGRRYELVAGWLDVSPAPKMPHTVIGSRLVTHVNNIAPYGFMALSGPGVTFGTDRTTHRIPDLAVIHDDAREYPYLTRPPPLAIEVLSPESVFRDNETKRREYAHFGITAYWIVSPSENKPSILELRLQGDEYREAQHVYGHDVFETDVPFRVRLVPYWLIADDGSWRDRIGGREQ